MQVYYAAFMPDAGKYSVIFPDLPGCHTWGHTLEEAFTRAVEALVGHLEALANDGDPLPAPSASEAAFAMLQARLAELEEELPSGSQLLPVPTHKLNLRQVRVNVSFKRYTLDMIDRKAEAVGMTRSAFLARAAQECTLK